MLRDGAPRFSVEPVEAPVATSRLAYWGLLGVAVVVLVGQIMTGR